MDVIESKDELRELLREWRHEGGHIALVATMGNLHDGHMSLIETAREHAERIVVSVFVNPTQFGEDEDFGDYPRTLERDTRRLRKSAADVLFVPSVEAVYPFGLENATRISVPGFSENFCGLFRPGHFDGVASVVARLFAIVQPDAAIFGEKDFQQQLVIRRMAEDLSLPITIITAPTIREEDGLAMSSRNAYLTEEERQRAPGLYRVLSGIGEDLQNGRRNFEELESRAWQELESAGFDPEYVAIRRALDLGVPDRDCDELVVLAAARLGTARLIDNVVLTI